MGALQKWQMVPHALARGWKKAAKQSALDAAYEVVNQRDENKSRITGRYLSPSSPDPARRREHCHIKGRRVRPEWREDPKRIFLGSALEHKLLHGGALLMEGEDATKRLVFTWNRSLVPANKEPFRILSKRRSQNA